MRPAGRLTAALLATWLPAMPARAQHSGAASGRDAPVESDGSAGTTSRSGRLRLGPHGNPYTPLTPEGLKDLPHFETAVDVNATAPPDPNETMQVWWKRFNFETAVYGRGYDIRKPAHPGTFDLVPLFQWLKKKAKERKDRQ